MSTLNNLERAVLDKLLIGDEPGAVNGWMSEPGYDGGEGRYAWRTARTIDGALEESDGYFHATASDGTAAHEAGHLLGLHHQDAPSEIKKGSDGKLERIRDRKNIMSTLADRRQPGARPSQAQVEKVVREKCNSGCR